MSVQNRIKTRTLKILDQLTRIESKAHLTLLVRILNQRRWEHVVMQHADAQRWCPLFGQNRRAQFSRLFKKGAIKISSDVPIIHRSGTAWPHRI